MERLAGELARIGAVAPTGAAVRTAYRQASLSFWLPVLPLSFVDIEIGWFDPVTPKAWIFAAQGHSRPKIAFSKLGGSRKALAEDCSSPQRCFGNEVAFVCRRAIKCKTFYV